MQINRSPKEFASSAGIINASPVQGNVDGVCGRVMVRTKEGLLIRAVTNNKVHGGTRRLRLDRYYHMYSPLCFKKGDFCQIQMLLYNLQAPNTFKTHFTRCLFYISFTSMLNLITLRNLHCSGIPDMLTQPAGAHRASEIPTIPPPFQSASCECHVLERLRNLLQSWHPMSTSNILI
jgi:hypothetical protein